MNVAVPVLTPAATLKEVNCVKIIAPTAATVHLVSFPILKPVQLTLFIIAGFALCIAVYRELKTSVTSVLHLPRNRF